MTRPTPGNHGPTIYTNAHGFKKKKKKKRISDQQSSRSARNHKQYPSLSKYICKLLFEYRSQYLVCIVISFCSSRVPKSQVIAGSYQNVLLGALYRPPCLLQGEPDTTRTNSKKKKKRSKLINGPGPGILFFWWLALGFHVLFCIDLFFFFFWINRLCTLNSQKPSLELQSPKSQGFNFNWFSCCEYNPYPPLWTFFFFFFVWPMWIPKFQFFFFFFFFQLLWHPIRFLSQHPKVHEKNPTTHHKPVLWFFFFFNIATSCLYIPRVLAYSPTLHWHLF